MSMTVFQIVSQADAESVIQRYAEFYGTDNFCNVEHYRRFVQMMADEVTEIGHFTTIKVMKHKCFTEFPKEMFDEEPTLNAADQWSDDVDVIGVAKRETGSLRIIDADDQDPLKPELLYCNVDMELWGRVKAVPVETSQCYSNLYLEKPSDRREIPLEMSINEIATHLYYDLTLHGWMEEGQLLLDELLDRAEEFDRQMQNS